MSANDYTVQIEAGKPELLGVHLAKLDTFLSFADTSGRIRQLD
jgi:hypothetical protein